MKWVLVILLVVIITYLLGPRSKYKAIDTTPLTLDIPLKGLDAYIADRESEVVDLKIGNEAEIVWFDSTMVKTEFSVVYLHGFSASREEGAPLHTQFAERYGMNLYLPRLFDHGRKSEDSFKNLLPEDLINSAKEAIAVAKLLGDKVILLTCSTGSTLAAILASDDEAVHSVYMYSPNIDVADKTSALVTGPWGRHILKAFMGGEYNHVVYDSLAAQYWSEVYHIDGIVSLKFLIEQYMTPETFDKFEKPLFLGYYYRDKDHQDEVVSVDRMLDFYNQISTPPDYKRAVVFPEVGRHVFTSYVFAEDMARVTSETFRFAEEVLGLAPVVR